MIVTERREGDALVLSLRGDADLAAVPKIQERLRAAMAGGEGSVVVDFSQTEFVNTPVWALVVEYYQHTLKSETRLAVAGLHGRVLASFEMVRLGEFIGSHASVEAAVRGEPAGHERGAK